MENINEIIKNAVFYVDKRKTTVQGFVQLFRLRKLVFDAMNNESEKQIREVFKTDEQDRFKSSIQMLMTLQSMGVRYMIEEAPEVFQSKSNEEFLKWFKAVLSIKDQIRVR